MIDIGAVRGRRRIVAVSAVLLMMAASLPLLSEPTEAEAASAIGLAPGFVYSYSPSYPSDLEVTTEIESCGSGLDATFENGTLRVSVKDGVRSGAYDVVLKATTNTGGIAQTVRQTLTFTVVSGLSVSGSIGDVVLGDSVSFTPTASSDMGKVEWKVKEGSPLPAGLTLSNGKVFGTPATLGNNTVSLTATAAGESRDLVVGFTVYPRIVGGSDEVINSHGNRVASTAVSNAADIHVTWKVVSGTIPQGFALDPGTAVISGSSSAADMDGKTVTLQGSSSHGPVQTATKKVTIRTENALSLSSSVGKVYVWDGRDDVTVKVSSPTSTSDVTYSLSAPTTGVSVDAKTGVVKITDDARTGTVKVRATTGLGQSSETSFDVVREEKLSLTLPQNLAAVAGRENGADVSATERASWSVDASNAPAGASVAVRDGRLVLSSSSPTGAFDVTVGASTAGGQSAYSTVHCRVYNVIAFTSAPVAGIIAYEG